MEAALFFYSRLIFVIVARDLFEQIVGVVVVEFGIVQVVAAWFRIVVQHVGARSRVSRDLADFDFAFDAHAQRFGDFLHPREGNRSVARGFVALNLLRCQSQLLGQLFLRQTGSHARLDENGR